MSLFSSRRGVSRRRMLTRLASTGAGVGIAGLTPTVLAAERQRLVEEKLEKLVTTRADVDDWLAQTAFPFSKYDADLGYLHRDREIKEGLDNAICRYRYDDLDARRMFAYADMPCRINTYGNSFTSCEQVSDAETWQEVLAGHLGEPVRNYGIGGYSVYQAYLRMLREEERAPAKMIIFNIFDDDHYRNLLTWQRIRFGMNRKSINPTVPYVTVDSATGHFEMHKNPCPTAASVYDLVDRDKVFERFRHDPILHNRIDREIQRDKGVRVPSWDYDDEALTREGIYATTRILDKVQEYAKQHGKTVLYVLTYGGYTVQQYLETGRRFDQALVEYLQAKQLPVADVMLAHAEDYKQFQVPIRKYLSRYFVGHYNPAGNLFCAYAIKPKLVELLNPKPPLYGGPVA